MKEPRWSGHSADRATDLVSEHDERQGENGLTPVRRCRPARVHQDTSLALEVMSNALAIDDGHPLALELESLRATVAKYQVSTIISLPLQPIP